MHLNILVGLELFFLYLAWEHEGKPLRTEGINKAEAKGSYEVRCNCYLCAQSTCQELIKKTHCFIAGEKCSFELLYSNSAF